MARKIAGLVFILLFIGLMAAAKDRSQPKLPYSQPPVKYATITAINCWCCDSCGIGSCQGNQVLVMGPTGSGKARKVNNIVSWGNPPGYIVFTVPDAPPGQYSLYIIKESNIISNYLAFTVQ